ncbi:hypothetical protein PYW07_006542 [Mythimna separata]|uniref:Uncharacterized protein n=1 Tax=Mythimna separata TaxID=271217 RepID=A0AAD7YTV5_MYTSE|nr:hypothetical protein PYW07_006542 [Mythimna separata]
MNLILWAGLALGMWPNVFAIYYLDRKEIFQPPTDRDLRSNSYFGYSVTYFEVDETLVISAPREDNIGVVYTCPIENRTCTSINTTGIIKRLFSNYTHDYWFGATVKAGRDFVMICAPRYTTLFKPPDVPKENFTHVTNGRCYSYTALGGLKERMPISEERRRNEILDYKAHPETAMDSFGWSIEVTPTNSVIVGGPGMYHGRVMRYKSPDIHAVPTLLDKACSWKTCSARSTGKFNFGYAIATGMFIKTELSNAISSKFGTTGKGRVLFYDSKKYLNKYIEDTSHVGSMFGGVLCAARLYGNRTDLLVGAPAYATKDTYNLGAVYVYLSRNMSHVPEFQMRILGKVSGSMFGTAIINVGDLNGDEKDEIAISAPFEKDGQGVVYLYSGADLIKYKKDSDLKYLQKIEADEKYGESFGMSLSPLLDYDKNGCKELAIGSPYKNTVVLLRCMAAVKVETSNPEFYNLNIRNNSQIKFAFEVCLSVKYPTLPQKVIAELLTTVKITHDKLFDFNGKAVFTNVTSLEEKRPKYCSTFSLFLPEDGLYESQVSYTVSTKLLNHPATLPDFNSSRVILSDLSVLKKNDSVWVNKCDTCVVILTLEHYISFQHEGNPYIIGSSENETVRMTVHNIGDGVEYEPCVRLSVIGVNVLATPIGCLYEDFAGQNTLLCKGRKPILPGNKWTTDAIVLEMTQLTNLDKNIIINVLSFDNCGDVDTKNESITIRVKSDHRGITTRGETDIGPIVKMTQEDIENNRKVMQHIYTITNKGPTNWKNLQVLVNLPTKPYIKYDDTPIKIYHSTSNYNCDCRFLSQDKTSKSYVCLIESLVKIVEYAKIQIPIYIAPGTLDGILKKDENVTIISSVKLKFSDDTKVERIVTTIMLEEPEAVPIETIIIAVVVGLCIVIITSVILYRVGFLQRKKREELEKLKKQVKRQTILRRSTMPSQAPQTDDQTKILENMEEENKNDQTQDLKTD